MTLFRQSRRRWEDAYRTPARLNETMKRWEHSLQSAVDEILEDSVNEFLLARQNRMPIDISPHPHSDYFPIKITKDFLPGAESGTLKVETVAGRGLWLFSLRQFLTNTLAVLHRHKWTILTCPAGMEWLTSDDPVVKLNFNTWKNYDFKGGWNSSGTEIFMPLGPHHLLYTRVGHRPPPRGTVLSRDLAQHFQQFTVEHAHRFVFSSECDERLPTMRRRHVSAADFASETAQWNRWHDEQTTAERELLEGMHFPDALATQP
jgi:hypothetical protein